MIPTVTGDETDTSNIIAFDMDKLSAAIEFSIQPRSKSCHLDLKC